MEVINTAAERSQVVIGRDELLIVNTARYERTTTTDLRLQTTSQRLTPMTMPSSSEKLRQKLNLKRYLMELAALTGRPVQVDELVSLEQTAALRAAQQKFVAQATASSEISFSDRGSERFKKFVRRLHDANPSPVYVWTQRTIDCGALLVPSLMDIWWNFDFSFNEERMLAFVTSDVADSLLLDFSELPTGEQRMELETQGANWRGVAY